MRIKLFTALAQAIVFALNWQRSTVCAQSTAFTYQGRLNDGASPANGIYDLRFAIYDSTNVPGSLIAGPLTNSLVAVSNGLFTTMLDFGMGVFTGPGRWLEIGVSAGGGVFTTLVPRQSVTSTPYAIQALSAGSVPAGAITSSMLAPGTVASNLLASGVSGVASSGVVLSEQEFSSNLFNQGYVRLGKVDLVPEAWRPLTNGPPLGDFQGLARRDYAADWTGSEMLIWGGQNNSGALNTGGRYNPATDTWLHMTTVGAPSAQSAISAVWSGTHFIVWGNSGPTRGGRYNPTTDSWLPVSEVSAPVARTSHTTIWTGTYMILWGGFTTFYQNTGARYNPATDIWSPVQTTGAPAVRGQHSAIWTGTEMIIWGGVEQHSCGMFCFTTTNYNDGARYNPISDTWTAMTTSSPPLKRYAHSAIWTGTEMIIWGGLFGEGTFAIATNLNTGARYSPSLNQWVAPTSTVGGAPAYRNNHRAHWTGSRMIIWGGISPTTNYVDGAQFNPTNNTWAPMSSAGAPQMRVGYNTVWSGSQMIYFGGDAVDLPGSYPEIGRRYTATNDTWSPMSPGGDPSARADHKAVWANTEMLAWGGASPEYALRSGGRLNPSRPPAQMWSSITVTGAPTARVNHTALWTGSEMLIWGGFNSTQALNTGGRYTPALNSWTPITTASAPSPRGRHVAVWTGDRMVVWGGSDGTNYLATGGRYNPAGNSWQTTSGVSAPAGRADATGVWSGSEMIVWGGQFVTGVTNFLNTGGRYDPVGNAWRPVSTSGAPVARAGHTAVFGSGEMIVWGGETQTGKTNSGARYQVPADTWVSLPATGAPSSRSQHAAVWAGTQMIVWGGSDGTNEQSSGARYEPLRDLWTATLVNSNTATARQRHTAVWSGTEMVIWGGRKFNGLSDDYLDSANAYTPQRTLYLYLRP